MVKVSVIKEESSGFDTTRCYLSVVGEKAPDFEADAVEKGEFIRIKLYHYINKGKWIVLYFYPLDYTFVCPTEIIAFQDSLEEFKKRNTEVLACSIDSKFTHLAWLKTPRKEGGIFGVEYPIISDIKREISKAYGVYNEKAGVSLRGLFIIDPDGIVQHQTVNNLDVGRSVEETLRLLDAFQYVKKTGEVCPANWKKGGATIKPNPQESKKFFEKTSG